MCTPPACVFEAGGGCNHRVGCAVDCGHITTAGEITLTARCPTDTSAWQHEGDMAVMLWALQGLEHGELQCPVLLRVPTGCAHVGKPRLVCLCQTSSILI